ncbi:hypothetical protein GWI33_007310 [Rhynchophorus ferrugineus]|uniref:Uncharacterized protein n=1 Tax=Rhynchophorus ferrugineus TaxID=354439 RepID=A0A834IHS6_RHYFE|nr:hypothetical protein GWI33_007310 [Rhynchophorus ferrugineus]
MSISRLINSACIHRKRKKNPQTATGNSLPINVINPRPLVSTPPSPPPRLFLVAFGGSFSLKETHPFRDRSPVPNRYGRLWISSRFERTYERNLHNFRDPFPVDSRGGLDLWRLA